MNPGARRNRLQAIREEPKPKHTTKVIVQCSFELEVYFPDDMDDEFIRFVVEENGCPGTGTVGGKLEELIEKSHEEGICWACGRNGENKVLSIERPK